MHSSDLYCRITDRLYISVGIAVEQLTLSGEYWARSLKIPADESHTPPAYHLKNSELSRDPRLAFVVPN
jgi:hypothetical protein